MSKLFAHTHQPSVRFNSCLLNPEPSAFTTGQACLTLRKAKLESHQISSSSHFFIKEVQLRNQCLLKDLILFFYVSYRKPMWVTTVTCVVSPSQGKRR